tara:strand:- start:331 stop:1242 length:912 start_codon:yes stop_codon:yes gene_type:complete
MNEKKQGWINLYKPKNISSHEVIKKIRYKFKVNKLGHAGTLDPLAEGILPIAIEKTTKLIPFVNLKNKKYIFTIKWGEQTSTDDIEGEVIKSSQKVPNEEDIVKKLAEFIGYIDQTPPSASAVKVGGKRAYKLFREKKNFILHPKKVFLKKVKLLKSAKNKTSVFEAECGKGFYIRSFVRDLAISLGTFGHVYHLKRTKVGLFSLKSAILLDDLLKIRQTLSEFNGILSSVSMLDDILAYEIEDREDLFNLSLGKSIVINLNNLINPSLNFFDNNFLFLSKNGNIVSYGKLNGNLFEPKKILL